MVNRRRGPREELPMNEVDRDQDGGGAGVKSAVSVRGEDVESADIAVVGEVPLAHLK